MGTEYSSMLMVGKHYNQYSEENKATLVDTGIVTTKTGEVIRLAAASPWYDAPMHEYCFGIELDHETDLSDPFALAKLVMKIQECKRFFESIGEGDVAVMCCADVW